MVYYYKPTLLSAVRSGLETWVLGRTQYLITISQNDLGESDLLSVFEFRCLCEDSGFSPVELARRLGVTVTTINRWRDGLGLPNRREEERLRRFVRSHYVDLEFIREQVATD